MLSRLAVRSGLHQARHVLASSSASPLPRPSLSSSSLPPSSQSQSLLPNSSSLSISSIRFHSESPSQGEKHDTNIKVFNSLSGKKESFILPHRGHVIKWYTCGPTVYDQAHLGHARSYVQIDILIRILSNFFGYQVDHVMGLTNIDDKIIVRAKELGITPEELALKFEEEFFSDMEALGVMRPTRIGRVTEHLEEIVDFVSVLQKKGFAYTANGSVYFDSEAFGAERRDKLNPHSHTKDNIGYDSGDPQKDALVKEKKNPADFALWKKSKEGELGWANPFSSEPGRPGWHIECSAVASKQLGAQFDVHAGGIDLMFPHHNNELNQSDACFDYHRTGPQWCNYFFHTGHLHIQGRKMSKSLKNFISIQEFLKANNPTWFRLFCLQLPFNSNVDFTPDRMKDAQKMHQRFRSFFSRVDLAVRETKKAFATADRPQGAGYGRKWEKKDISFHQFLTIAKSVFRSRLEDNFDTPEAINVLHDIVRETNLYIEPAASNRGGADTFQWPKDSLTHVNARDGGSLPVLSLVEDSASFVRKCLEGFGLDLQLEPSLDSLASSENANSEESVKALVYALGSLRQTLRAELKKPAGPDKRKLFAELDKIRDQTLPAVGYAIRDLADGSFTAEKVEAAAKSTGENDK